MSNGNGMDLEGKRLALLGFGVENRALGAWLAAHGLSAQANHK